MILVSILVGVCSFGLGFCDFVIVGCGLTFLLFEYAAFCNVNHELVIILASLLAHPVTNANVRGDDPTRKVDKLLSLLVKVFILMC